MLGTSTQGPWPLAHSRNCGARVSLIVAALLAASCSKGSGTPSAPSTSATTSQQTVVAAACSTWAGQQRGSGVPSPPASVSSARQAFYDAGGGIRSVAGKYYAAYFSSG